MLPMRELILRFLGITTFLCLILAQSACTGARHVTPGAPADFPSLGISQAEQANRTGSRIQAALDRKPAAAFPSTIAILRVQDRGYETRSTHGYGNGRFSIVTVRDVETDEAVSRLARMPQVRGLAPINRLIVPSYVNNEEDLRTVGATVHADILLLYTFDTRIESDLTVPGLGFLSLGLIPNEVQRGYCTVSAAFIDVRTGFIFGTAEGSGTSERLNNAWGTDEAMDMARLVAERKAFEALVPQIEGTWAGGAKEYGPPSSN